MNSYLDLHCHILPGIDDGSDSWDETLEMFQAAYNEDIRIIIATPHYGLYNQDFDIDSARQLVEEANTRMKSLPYRVDVFLGNEIYYVPGIVRDVLNGRAATIAGSSYVLIEFSVDVDYETVEKAVQEFTRECYRPIIAHVERYRNLIDTDLEQIRELRRLGAYFQVNTGNFIRKSGLFKKDSRTAFAKAMLQAGMVDFVASDAHNATSRKPVMKTAVESIRRIANEEQCDRLFIRNPIALAGNEYIDTEQGR